MKKLFYALFLLAGCTTISQPEEENIIAYAGNSYLYEQDTVNNVIIHRWLKLTDNVADDATYKVTPYMMCGSVENIDLNTFPKQNHDDYLTFISNPNKFSTFKSGVWTVLPHLVIWDHIWTRKFFNVIYDKIKTDYPAFDPCNLDMTITYLNTESGNIEIHQFEDIMNWVGGFDTNMEIDKAFHHPTGNIIFDNTQFTLIDRETGADITQYPVPHTTIIFDMNGLNY